MANALKLLYNEDARQYIYYFIDDSGKEWGVFIKKWGETKYYELLALMGIMHLMNKNLELNWVPLYKEEPKKKKSEISQSATVISRICADSCQVS